MRWIGAASTLTLVACTSRPLGEGTRSGDRTVPIAAPAPPAAASPDPDAVASCIDDGDPVSVASLREQVAFLASPALAGRAAGTPGDVAARDHVAARFRCLGLLPGGADDSYDQPFTAGGRSTANVVGYVPGTDPDVGSDIVVVGAHLDHLGETNDGVYLGANDNASGVAALLAIAQVVRARDAGPRRTIAFVAFADEETGLVGSRFYVTHPPAELAMGRVVQMINLDMVGSYSSRDAVFALGSFRGLPGRKALDALMPAYKGLTVKRGGRGSGSDHKPFCDRGIPYIFFWTPDDRCYHETCDAADRVDYANLARITALAGDLTFRLADTPTDLAESRARAGCGH